LNDVYLSKSSVKEPAASRSTILWRESAKNTPTLSFECVPPLKIDRLTFFLVANYTFGTKEAQPEEDPSVLSRLNRLQEHYEKYGMRRSCEAILIVFRPSKFDGNE